MKIVIERMKFQSALNCVKDVVGGDLAILANVKMETINDDEIRLTATNLDQTISTVVKCQIVEPGEVTVPARLVAQMVSAMTSAMVEFKHDGKASKAVLSGGDVTYKICTLPPKEFPLPAEVMGTKLTFTKAEMKELLTKTCYAASVDSTRRSLVGVCIQTKDGKLHVVATDGRRLAYAWKDKASDGDCEVVIPSATVKILQRLLTGEGDVDLIIQNGRAAKFLTSEWSLQTKIVDDLYPNWRQVIPKDMSNHINIDRNSLIESVKQVSLSSDSNNTNIVAIIKDGVITLSSSSSEVSDATAMIPVKYNGDELKVNLNPYYVLDAVGSFVDDEVTLGITTGTNPITFTHEGTDALAVVMPLRVN